MTKINYRQEIDGLRAIAVVPVILFHAGFNAFSGGFVGVDVFFVISGYLITTIILSELEQGKFSIVNFYERRARRILPALFFVLLVILPFAWLWLLPGDMKGFSKSLATVSVFASNIQFWIETGYFDRAAELKLLLHTWSLAVEEQYYLLFPAFLMLIWRLGERWILVLFAIIGITSLAVAQWASLAKPGAAFYLIPTRGWELMIGAFAAFYLADANRTEFSKSVGEVGGWLGVSLILYSVFAYSNETPFPGLYALVPTIGTVLIILFATQQTIVGKLVGNKVFVGIGLISYSAYLWHHPLFAFARHRSLIEPSHLAFAVLSVVAFLLAYLSWRYVENPFRNKHMFKRKAIFGLSLFFSLFFISIGLLGQGEGFEFRFKRVLSGDVGQSEFHRYMDDGYFECEPSSIATQAATYDGYLRCWQSKVGIPDTVLLGDSHAEHLFLGIAENRPDLNVVLYMHPGGKPYISNPEFRVIFNELLNNGKSQNILLTMYFDRYSGYSSDLYEGFSSTIESLTAAGNNVTLLGDVPTFSKNPGYCLYGPSFKEFSSSCYLSKDDVGVQRNVYEPILKRLSVEFDVPYIEIDRPLCFNSKCGMINHDSVFYRDVDHLNILGSKLVGGWVAEKLPF